jgi:hypothetical protein
VLLAEHDELVRRSATLLGLRQLAGGCGRREALVPIIPRSPAGRLVSAGSSASPASAQQRHQQGNQP